MSNKLLSCKILFGLLILTNVVMLSVSCHTYRVTEGSHPAQHVRHPMAPQARVQLNNVGILDSSIRIKIAVESTSGRRTPTGTLEAWTMLRNRTDYPLQVEGRIQFFDAGGAPVEGPTAWHRIYMPPNGIATYKEFSTKVQEISFYYIEIREGR